jgi:hypothetical protein
MNYSTFFIQIPGFFFHALLTAIIKRTHAIIYDKAFSIVCASRSEIIIPQYECGCDAGQLIRVENSLALLRKKLVRRSKMKYVHLITAPKVRARNDSGEYTCFGGIRFHSHTHLAYVINLDKKCIKFNTPRVKFV